MKCYIDGNLDNSVLLMFMKDIVDQKLSARFDELLPPIGIHASLHSCVCYMFSAYGNKIDDSGRLLLCATGFNMVIFYWVLANTLDMYYII